MTQPPVLSPPHVGKTMEIMMIEKVIPDSDPGVKEEKGKAMEQTSSCHSPFQLRACWANKHRRSAVIEPFPKRSNQRLRNELDHFCSMNPNSEFATPLDGVIIHHIACWKEERLYSDSGNHYRSYLLIGFELGESTEESTPTIKFAKLFNPPLNALSTPKLKFRAM